MKKTKKLFCAIIGAMVILACTSCGNSETSSTASSSSKASSSAASATSAKSDSDDTSSDVVTTANVSSDGIINAADLFTERDLKQTADLSEAEKITLSDGKDVNITKAGVYVISGSASDVTITVEAADDDKVQLVLDGATIKNTDSPAIYVKNADKTFITTTGENSLSVTGTFTADGETNTDAVIFAKDDVVLNGTGSLTIDSTDNGISCKNDIKITGGTIDITAVSDAIEAEDSVAIADGSVKISSQKDGIHAENSDDNSAGYVYICGGTLEITADDDALHATTAVQIDGGELTLSGAEGIEGTYIQINDGTITIDASDDGVNAANKSSSYDTTFEINGGSLTVNMGQGDTDGIDSNGNLYIRGGTVNITGQSPFDYDGEAEHTGGTIIVNGTETDEITNQFMGGGGMGGGPGGNMQGGFGGGMRGGV